MKDAATILKELGCKEATVNGYRNEIWIEYDHTNLVLHYTEEDEDDVCRGTRLVWSYSIHISVR